MIIVTATGIVDQAGNRLGSTLTGVDGSTWDLVAGPVKLRPGVKGFGSGDPEHFWSDAPSLDGSAWLGMRYPRADVVLPLNVKAANAAQWGSTHSALMRAVDPSGEATWSVTRPDGRTLTRRVRLVDGADAAYDIDPFLIRYAGLTLDFAAADPFWRGPPTTVALTPGTNTLASTFATNPGDLPVWPKYVIPGPFSSAYVGILDAGVSKVVQISAAVTAGHTRIVDMDPRSDSVAVVDELGGDRWSEVVDRTFAQIPAGTATVRAGWFPGLVGGTRPTYSLIFSPAYRVAW